jgi:hypothetical protein
MGRRARGAETGPAGPPREGGVTHGQPIPFYVAIGGEGAKIFRWSSKAGPELPDAAPEIRTTRSLPGPVASAAGRPASRIY